MIFLFIMGLVWGSFLNVVIYRTTHGKSPADGRSRCPKCKKIIPWKFNIPVISFLILRGKCANCKKKISWQYPVIELMSGLLFVWWYLMGMQFFRLIGSPWQLVQPIFWLMVGMILLTIFMTDLLYGVIPLSVNLIFFTLVLVYRVTLVAFGQMNPIDLWLAVLSALGVTTLFFILQKATKLIKKVDGLGDGDIALSPTLGLLLGWPKITVGIFTAFVIGSVFGIALIGFSKKKINQTIPFGPFLVAGTIVALLWGGEIWSWYMGMLQ
ncbi:MAG: Type 4 prepilin-like protein leader peptide-processing enzyme [Candidatus Collierbacteria bacterium GW2011_GWC1_45_47]|uniref:Type 4 prepilin-like protein leader peptide-processing enzyme n=5 Tax=Candidatus Collieribacteriota TaxID=1752725 RepID=A0A0G1HJT1_9BACT|nr:MAG: Type 4 prepilin-like protein leader peptide-processing enzyme [Candidatus Collierbacteria bacterium GW2011_GWA1_44_12]KKT39261.1 MAG: Type 4 prepilin-like protein leader peptide-processing enzyme [Candidatus Collierbacteria bacterium GW2011_GWF1_44_12]KKT47185.1 MAG: Type 4 prepilin-like protein leader peptide-processing enzyme [Candidatus Collierbacteria bacterium GW2011_GWF2_44_15]KKT67866.1 MAG: Type 4 prepilin-like protein leader peptide-processing enzyme [Candidatus Collierbacteria 